MDQELEFRSVPEFGSSWQMTEPMMVERGEWFVVLRLVSSGLRSSVWGGSRDEALNNAAKFVEAADDLAGKAGEAS